MSLRRIVDLIITLLVLSIILVHNCMGVSEYCWWGGVIVWYDNPRIEELVGCYPKYVIVDPDYGSQGTSWSVEDLVMLKSIGVKVIAYINIGFAEEWRSY